MKCGDEAQTTGAGVKSWVCEVNFKECSEQSSKLASERENEPGYGADGDSNVCRQLGDVCWLCQQLLQYSTSEKSLVSIS